MAASDYTIEASAPMCPIGYVASAVGYSAPDILLSSLINVAPGDVKVGMAAMIDDEIVKVTSVNYPSIGVERGCADTVPAVHQVGSIVWFFGQTTGTVRKAYTATDEIAVKLLPYTTSGANIPVDASPPNDITFNWRHVRPYPPGRVLCKDTAWYLGYKEMTLGSDEIGWSWVHRDRLLQADQLVPHSADSIGPEPGTTYTIEVINLDGEVLRTVTGITGTAWTYTREMAEADNHELPEAYVDLWSERAGLRSLQKYRTLVRLIGADRVTIDCGALGWPGLKTNCGMDGQGGLTNAATETWDTLDVEWDVTEESWANTATSPMVYEHPPYDLGVLGQYRLLLSAVGEGTVVSELSTSSDGISYNSWTVPSPNYVNNVRFVKARFTVSGPNPNLSSAKISYFRRS